MDTVPGFWTSPTQSTYFEPHVQGTRFSSHCIWNQIPKTRYLVPGTKWYHVSSTGTMNQVCLCSSLVYDLVWSQSLFPRHVVFDVLLGDGHNAVIERKKGNLMT